MFLQSSYAPAVFKDDTDVFDAGGAFIRWESRFALAGTFNATHTGSLAGGTPKDPSTADGYWHESASLSAFVPIDPTWAASLTMTDVLPYGRTIVSSSSSAVETTNSITISPAILVALVPQKLALLVSYTHGFGYSYSNSMGPAHANVAGANIFGVTLSSTFLPDAIANAVN